MNQTACILYNCSLSTIIVSQSECSFFNFVFDFCSYFCWLPNNTGNFSSLPKHFFTENAHWNNKSTYITHTMRTLLFSDKVRPKIFLFKAVCRGKLGFSLLFSKGNKLWLAMWIDMWNSRRKAGNNQRLNYRVNIFVQFSQWHVA